LFLLDLFMVNRYDVTINVWVSRRGPDYYQDIETTWGAFASGCVGEGPDRLYDSLRKTLEGYGAKERGLKISLDTSVKKSNSTFWKEINREHLFEIWKNLSKEGFNMQD